MKRVIVAICSCVALFFVMWVSFGSGEMAGNIVGVKIGYSEGFKDGQVFQATVGSMPIKVKETAPESKPEAKQDISEWWTEVPVGNKSYFVSVYSAPVLLNKLGKEEAYHYIYATEGVFAFPVETFSAEEVFVLMSPHSSNPQRYYGGAVPKHAF